MKTQLSLFDVVGLKQSTTSLLSSRELIVEQIIRDEKVLREGPDYWVPNREFFEQRIRSYREYLIDPSAP